MMQPTEDRAGAARAGAPLRNELRHLQVQGPVRAQGVARGDELAEHCPQVPLVQDDQVVRAPALLGRANGVGTGDSR
jgi:hypothetical protein